MHPRQTVAARGLLDWTQLKLAEKAKIGVNSVKLWERSKGNTSAVVVEAMKRSLEDAGIKFIPDNGGGIGVRFKDRIE